MSTFVDECGLNVWAGDGGAGSVSFRREAHVDRGGPDGGDGGAGGDIWLVADHNIASLLAFRDHPHRRAASGTHGMGKKRHGSAGADLVIAVPVGTVVKDHDGEILADLDQDGARWLGAKGGAGGRGNARFLSNRRRAPSFAEQGEAGEQRWLRLELKLLADVALVGFPNAGKSTLISAISAARPRIADYPFTTLEPNLGVVRVEDGFELVVADIPGLIEGAAEGKGLGHQFLRHIERARVLLILVDLASYEGRSPDEQVRVLLDELGSYRPELLTRPRLLVATKADVATAEPPPGVVAVTSAVTGAGLAETVGAMARTVAATREAERTEGHAPVLVVHRPPARGIRVDRDEHGTFVVTGRAAERAVALNDLTNPDALAYVQERLTRLGVDKALVRAGVRDGDEVTIGGFAFEYREDGWSSADEPRPRRRIRR